MIAQGIDEAAVYAEFQALAKEIHVPVLQLHHALELRDKYGNIIDRRPKQLSHSFNRNAFNWMFSQLAAHPFDDVSFGASFISIKDSGNNVRSHASRAVYATRYGQRTIQSSSIEIDTVSVGYNAEVTNDDFGILIGTGSGAEGFGDHALTTPIAHGNAATQMHHADTNDPAWAWDEGTDTLTSTFSRFFKNNRGISLIKMGYHRLKSILYSPVQHFDVATKCFPRAGCGVETLKNILRVL